MTSSSSRTAHQSTRPHAPRAAPHSVGTVAQGSFARRHRKGLKVLASVCAALVFFLAGAGTATLVITSTAKSMMGNIMGKKPGGGSWQQGGLPGGGMPGGGLPGGAASGGSEPQGGSDDLSAWAKEQGLPDGLPEQMLQMLKQQYPDGVPEEMKNSIKERMG